MQKQADFQKGREKREGQTDFQKGWKKRRIQTDFQKRRKKREEETDFQKGRKKNKRKEMKVRMIFVHSNVNCINYENIGDITFL